MTDNSLNNHPPALEQLAAAADEDGDSKLPALDNIGGEHNIDEQETYVYRDFSTLPAPENM